MSRANSIRILYIEDDIITATRVQMQLDQRGYMVDLAMDGKEGLAKIETHTYDVVAVDYHLPGMNGLQVLQNLAQNPFKMPAIMVTGAGNERIAVEAMKLGAGDYLVKDTDNHYLELLPTIIESELQKQQLIIEKQQAEEALHCRDTILEAVSFAAQKFLVATYWDEPIQEILAHLGQAVAASRVYLFENHFKNSQLKNSQPIFFDRSFSEQTLGNLLASQRYEWVANGITPQINNPLFQNISYAPHFQERAQTLAQGKPIYGLTQYFSEPEMELLVMGNVLSIAIVPVFVNKKWWGFIGYDDCLEEREWPPVVIEAFKTAASLLGAAIQHDEMNKALRKSEKRLAETQRLAHLGHCDWDLFTNTRRLSEEALKIFGWNSNSHLLNNKTFVNAIHPEDRQMVKEATHQSLFFDKPYDIEFRIIRSDGQIRYLHALSELIRENGKPRKFLGTAQDITAYKAVEIALRESTQTLSAILNAATDSIVMMELDTTCVIINPAGAKRLGCEVVEVVGQRLCDLVAQDVALKRKQIVDEVIRTRQSTQFEDEETQGVWFEHSIYPVFNESATIDRIAIVSREITRRKKMEEALKYERDFTNAIINTAGSLVIVLDRMGRIVRFNNTCSNLTGYTFEEIKDCYIWDFLLANDKIEMCKQYFKNLVTNRPTSQRYEVNWLTKNKNRRLIDWSHTVLTNDNQEVDYVIGTGIDITERKRAEDTLACTLAELEIILDNSPIGIAFLSQQQHFIRVNRKLEEMCGYMEHELKYHTPKILSLSLKDNKTFDNENSTTDEILMHRKDNTSFWCHVKVKEIDPNDPAKGFIWSFEDITEKRQAEKNLRLAATVFETTKEAILVTDVNNHIIMTNPAFTTITGYSFDEVMGKNPNVLSSGRHNTEFYQDMWNSLLQNGKWQGEMWNRCKNGHIYIEWISITTIQDANHKIVQYVAVFTDITERKHNEELILHQAHHDALTNLPNRLLFVDRLKQALLTAKRHQGRVAVMFIDLDRFKSVNDTLGHDFGDLLLKEVAQRLVACVRESDTVARLGGDEFTVILTQILNISDIRLIAQRMLKSLSQSFTLKDKQAFIGGSIGIAFFPKDGQEAETLVKKADIAMYHAKQEGRNTFRFYGLA